MNALTTGLIAGRVWWHKRNVEKAFGDRERSITYLFVLLLLNASSFCTVPFACLLHANISNHKSCTHPDVRHTEYYDWVIAIVIESGAVYTACLICELVLYRMNNSGTFIIVGILSQVVVCWVFAPTLSVTHSLSACRFFVVAPRAYIRRESYQQ